jgi:hypothetical protein
MYVYILKHVSKHQNKQNREYKQNEITRINNIEDRKYEV